MGRANKAADERDESLQDGVGASANPYPVPTSDAQRPLATRKPRVRVRAASRASP